MLTIDWRRRNQRQGDRKSAITTAEHALELLEKDNMRDETRDFFRGMIRKLLSEVRAAPGT